MRGGTDDGDLFLHRFQETFVRLQFLAGIAVLDAGFIDVGLGVVQVILE